MGSVIARAIVKWAVPGCLFLCIASCTSPSPKESQTAEVLVEPVSFYTGAEVLQRTWLPRLSGKRVGLIVNHTALVGDQHLIDVLHEAADIELVALFGPEHGIRGDEDAGEKVADGIDQRSGVPVYSLYQGDTRKPAPESLEGIDVLIFDIQDVGSRFYTYISTLGLTMQAAAEAGIDYMVLDRPNPLGGAYVSGFVLEPANTSFVGQYPIPVAHGLTVGELALLIKGEALMDGLEALNLDVVTMEGWDRSMKWTDLDRPWVPTSPNIPDIETAMIYAGTCFFEAVDASEGRGTRSPFKQVGASWANAEQLAQAINGYELAGVQVSPIVFTPESIEGMSSNPRFNGEQMNGVTIEITDASDFDPLSTGIHVLHAFYQARPDSQKDDFINDRWLRLLAGTDRLQEALESGRSPQDIVLSWEDEVEAFRALRMPYLLYP